MEYYDAPPVHPFAAEIVQLEDKLDTLQSEFDLLTADTTPWSDAGEDRCIVLEKLIKEVESKIESLYYYE